jgi:uncharacterized protein YqeY
MPALQHPPADLLRTRLAAQLRAAMKARDQITVATLRSVLSALDNAGAIAETAAHVPMIGLSSDVPRTELTTQDIDRVLAAETREREVAAADYERRGLGEGAARLRAEIAIIARIVVGE